MRLDFSLRPYALNEFWLAFVLLTPSVNSAAK